MIEKEIDFGGKNSKFEKVDTSSKNLLMMLVISIISVEGLYLYSFFDSFPPESDTNPDGTDNLLLAAGGMVLLFFWAMHTWVTTTVSSFSNY